MNHGFWLDIEGFNWDNVFARLGISVAADIAGPGRICGDGAYAMHASRLHHRQYGAC